LSLLLEEKVSTKLTDEVERIDACVIKQNIGENMEEQNTLVTLIDEQGNEVEFDLVATFDYEKKRYAALIPIDEVENVNEDEVVILEVVKDSDGERYLPIENDILLDEVFNEFLEILDEMAEGDED
jgi:uncharacterized protein YrzB (UPF0473 family)